MRTHHPNRVRFGVRVEVRAGVRVGVRVRVKGALSCDCQQPPGNMDGK